RLFSQITLAGRGRPLTSYDVVINTISAVTTRTGLAVTAVLDPSPCPTGTQISDGQIKDIEDRHLTRHEFHGERNSSLLPPPTSRPTPTTPAGAPFLPGPPPGRPRPHQRQRRPGRGCAAGGGGAGRGTGRKE